MKFRHHDKPFCVPDEWWNDAGMNDFAPSSNCYRATKCSSVTEITLDEIQPVYRSLAFGVFNRSPDDPAETAKARVVKILGGFKAGAAIPPVEAVQTTADPRFRFRLKNGAHRFYLSIAAGYTHIPCILCDDEDD